MSLLLFLLFLAPTIQYRIELGGFSFAIMEPIVLIVSVILLTHQVMTRRRLTISKDSFIFLVAGMVLWASIVRPWAADWKHGVSDVRDWVIPLLGFIALSSTVRHGWRRWIGVFLFIAVLTALVGIYQHFTDSFRPFVSALASYKTGFVVAPDDGQLTLVSYAAGFFSHPNGLAEFLFIGLMISLGWLVEPGQRWWKIVVLAVIALALLWTYAKTSLIVAGLAIVLFWLQHWIKTRKTLLAALAITITFGGVGLWIAAQHVPATLLNTFWWRVGLWQTAFNTISQNPSILLVGNGLDIFALHAYYPQPHDMYLYLLLQYGVLGLMFGLIAIGQIWRRGWQARTAKHTKQEPVLAGLWIALLGYFVIGLVESELFGIESRMIFLMSLACFIGLNRELRREASLPASTKEGYQYADAQVAHPRAV